MRKFEDFYNPTDFYGQAFIIAKKYCNSHKLDGDDEKYVYAVVREAVEQYETNSKLCKIKFNNYVHWCITDSLYRQKWRLKQNMTNELKASIIKDYESGMSIKDIAERYQINPKTTYQNLTAWSKKGLVELRASTPKEKPIHITQSLPKAEKIPYQKPEILTPPPIHNKKEPATVTPVTSPTTEVAHEIFSSINVPQEDENVKEIPDIVKEALLEKYEELRRERNILMSDLQDINVKIIELMGYIEEIGGSV